MPTPALVDLLRGDEDAVTAAQSRFFAALQAERPEPLTAALRGWLPHQNLACGGLSDEIKTSISHLLIARAPVDLTAAYFEQHGNAARLVPDDEGNTPLHLAATLGHVGLLARAPEVTNLAGETPVWVACRHGQSAAVQTLLAQGASPSQAALNGETPLHAAAQAGDLSCLTLLIEANINWTARTISAQPR